MARSIGLAGVLVSGYLLLLNPPTVSGNVFPLDAESTLVLVEVTAETPGTRNTVEINGKFITDYSPTIIYSFSSTGIVFDRKGHVLTFLGYRWVDIQDHDIRIEITGSDERKYEGRLVGIDQSTGVAVVQLPEAKLRQTPVCIRCAIEDGATVIAPAARHPGIWRFHEAQVVSVASGQYTPEHQGWVMTIAHAFPDVGQPILSADHRVLGFVASQDPSGERTIVYPISQLLSSADKILRARGDICTGWLGVFLSPALNSGVIIQSVEEGSPAQEAGLAAGDVIWKYNGANVGDARHFIQLVQSTPIGSKANLQITRRGKSLNIAAVVENRKPQAMRGRFSLRLPGAGDPQADLTIRTRQSPPLVGLDVVSLTPELAEFLAIPEQRGLLVLGVAKQMPADLAGVLVGDVIVSIDGLSVQDPQIFISHLQSRDWGEPMVLRLVRKKVEENVVIQLPSPIPRPTRKQQFQNSSGQSLSKD